MKKIIFFSIMFVASFVAQAQTGSRLIASVDLRYDGSGTYIVQDTSVKYYSGLRGGDLTHTLKFDSSVNWYPTTVGITRFRQTQVFDGSNNLLADTQQFLMGATWQLYKNNNYTY